jgi:spoIIIJ-associated protein
MIRVEALTLEEAYKNAASSLECSVTELKIELVQSPSNGFFGLFKKKAIIIAIKDETKNSQVDNSDENITAKIEESKAEPKEQTILNDTIMPASFVSTQDDEDEEDDDITSYLADYDDEEDDKDIKDISEIASKVKDEMNRLFKTTCFKIDSIEVRPYDENTLLVEFRGEDAALLIGKEGYRYKALSYMIFNWINTQYQVQLRLEIAEFLKNQEESVLKYLDGVCQNIESDGRAQTKILDGVLIQIALKELRDRYPDKYVVIRSTKDGLKYIIVNDYHSN